MYSRRILAEMHDEIEEQIQAMPDNYTSLEFYTSLERNHPHKYGTLIRSYMGRGHDRAHARQILHAQLMHTVNDRFSHLTRKVATIGNPKGGGMSQWVRP
jgi:hypothetical protein